MATNNRNQARVKVLRVLRNKLLSFTNDNENIPLLTPDMLTNYYKVVDNNGQIDWTNVSIEPNEMILYENLQSSFSEGQDSQVNERITTSINNILDCLYNGVNYVDWDGNNISINEPSGGWMYDDDGEPGMGGGTPDVLNSSEIILQMEWTNYSCATNTDIHYEDVLSALIKANAQNISMNQAVNTFDETNIQEILETDISELLPSQITKLSKIKKFFKDYSDLKGPKPGTQGLPGFTIDSDGVGGADQFETPEAAEVYRNAHDIHPENLEGFIPRREEDVVEDLLQTSNTLEWLRNDLDEYLKDEDAGDPSKTDPRPVYEDKSSGYLQIRNVNQSIMIRSQEGQDIGLEDWETDGFTITMWVKFLDKVNGGTLFNYGNPFRYPEPHGFSLETFIGGEKRYVKLTVRETDEITGENKTIDSHVGNATNPKQENVTATEDSQYTEIPIDLNEWYFIVATYDTEKDNAITENGQDNITDYWMGNCLAPTDETCAEKTHNSTHGNKCKVEIISKSDLLRARGYQTQ